MEMLTLLVQQGIAASLKEFLKAHRKPLLMLKMRLKLLSLCPHVEEFLNKQFGNYTTFWRFQKANSVAIY